MSLPKFQQKVLVWVSSQWLVGYREKTDASGEWWRYYGWTGESCKIDNEMQWQELPKAPAPAKRAAHST